MRLPKGTLVYIEPKGHMGATDHAMLETNGNLWIVRDPVEERGMSLTWCRSLATDEEHLWYDHEMQAAP